MKTIIIRLFFLLSLINLALADETIILNSKTVLNYSPKIGLALGGGAARGFAHIGVLEIFEENQIPIAAISGTSMGSLIGGTYAIGYTPAEITKLLSKIDFNDFFTTTPFPRRTYLSDYVPWHTFFSQEPIGLFSTYPAENFFKNITLEKDYAYNFDFDNYPVELRIIATDLETGSKKVFSKGPLYQAMSASMCLPLVFRPYFLQGYYYVDGGLVENIPISPLRDMPLNQIIAVDVSSQDLSAADMYQPIPYTWHFSNLMIKNLSKQNEADIDVLLELPRLSNLSRDDYQKYQEYIQYGRKTAQEKFSIILTEVSSFDAKAETLNILYIQNETSFNINLFTGNINKNQLLRNIYFAVGKKPVEVTISGNVLIIKNIYPKPAYTLTQSRINEIIITGNDLLSTDQVRSMIKLNTPTYYDPVRIEQITKYLYSTGRFYSVKTDLVREGDTDGIQIIFDVKEKQDGMLYLSGQYFSTEGTPEFELGLYNYYGLGKTKSNLKIKSGPHAGGKADFEIFDIQNTNAGLGISIAKENNSIPIFNRYYSNSLFVFDKTTYDFFLNYISYDYFYLSLGKRFNTYSFPLHNPSGFLVNTITHSDSFVFKIDFDSFNEAWVPASGLKFTSIWEEFIQLEGSTHEQKETFLWAAIPLPLGSFWFQHKDAAISNRAPAYLWPTIQPRLMPYGFRNGETFSPAFSYQRYSYVNKLGNSTHLELGFDMIKYNGFAETTKEIGTGIAVHYPSAFGLITIGRGANSYNNVLYFNLCKEI